MSVCEPEMTMKPLVGEVALRGLVVVRVPEAMTTLEAVPGTVETLCSAGRGAEKEDEEVDWAAALVASARAARRDVGCFMFAMCEVVLLGRLEKKSDAIVV